MFDLYYLHSSWNQSLFKIVTRKSWWVLLFLSIYFFVSFSLLSVAKINCIWYVLQLISSHLPRWLQVLLTEKFFNACVIHEEAKKNEKNVYCLDCCISICPHCLSPHSSHRLLQVLPSGIHLKTFLLFSLLIKFDAWFHVFPMSCFR